MGYEEECIGLNTHDVNKELRMLIKATNTDMTKNDYINQNVAFTNNTIQEILNVDGIEVTIIDEIDKVSIGGRNEKASKMIAKERDKIHEI